MFIYTYIYIYMCIYVIPTHTEYAHYTSCSMLHHSKFYIPALVLTRQL